MCKDYNNTTEMMRARNLCKSDDSLILRGIISGRYFHYAVSYSSIKASFISAISGCRCKISAIKNALLYPEEN